MQNLVDRFSEPSTWRGIFALLTAFGVAISPEMENAILAAGLGVIGLIGVFTSEAKK